MLATKLRPKNILKIRHNINKLYKSIHIFNPVHQQESDESGYKSVPHYNEKSSLVSKTSSVFPRIITPDLDLKRIFETNQDIRKSALQFNLNARHIKLDLIKLNEDFSRMIQLEQQIKELELQKEQISNRVNNLVKSKTPKRIVAQTDEFKDLIKNGNQIKHQIGSINEKLQPLQEIVKIACLRLPNSLHASNLKSIESNFNEHFSPHDILFSLNENNLKMCTNDWKQILKQETNAQQWSCVDISTSFDGLNTKYYVGAYAELEKAIVDYIHHKISSINKETTIGPLFEYIKSCSMFKSAVIEGCGLDFNDPREILNIVEFSSSGIELLHLTGASSLSALVLNFIRTKIRREHLPWTVFTNGNNYSPQKSQINRFDFLTLCADNSELLMLNNLSHYCKENLNAKGQDYIRLIKRELETNCDDLFNGNETQIDNLLIDYLKLFVYVFKDFNLPIHFRMLHANELHHTESFKVIFEAYLPSEHEFVTVRKKILFFGKV